MSAEAALKLIETEDVEQKSLTIIEQAKAIKVYDADSYILAGNMFKSLSDMLKEIDAAFDENISMWNKGHKAAVAKKKNYYEPVDTGRRAVKKLMSDYDLEQERIRQAEQRRLEEIARKEEEERRLQEAILAEESGQKEEAQAILEEPVYVAPVVVAKTTPKMEGGPVYRTVTKFKITDENLIPRQYLVADLVKIGGVVRALKHAANIPGIQVYDERC